MVSEVLDVLYVMRLTLYAYSLLVSGGIQKGKTRKVTVEGCLSINKVHLKLHIHLSQPDSEQRLQGMCENCGCFVDDDSIVISKAVLLQ